MKTSAFVSFVLVMLPSVVFSWSGQRTYTDTTWWDPYVQNITDSDTYLRRKFRQDVTDKTTGIGQEELLERLMQISAKGKETGEYWRITKAKMFAALVREQSIDVSPLDWFPAIAVWDRCSKPIAAVVKNRAKEVNKTALPEWTEKEWKAGNADGGWNMWQDFDHSVPDWRVILKLGFSGMKTRLEKYAVEGDPFYAGLAIVMDAMLAGIDRFIEQGRKNLGKCIGSRIRTEKEIACLERLRKGPPQTAYDMMMFVWLYFFWSEHLDGVQCRSLPELDVFLTPYYDSDIAAGRTTEAEFREQVKHFLWQWGSVANYWNQPAGFGGTKPDGTSAFNHVSRIILDVVDECALPTPKFLVKVAPNTPGWAWDKMLDMARRHRSIAFIGEEPAAKALKKWCEASDEDCRTMVLRGCYEFDLADSCNRTGCGYVNFLKPVEKMLAEAATGKGETAQIGDFAGFKAEYLRRLATTATRCREIAYEFEKVLSDVNPANLMTLSTEHALKTRRDAFANGCPRGNDTAILSAGLGTAVDSLLAVKEIVYEKKEMTLAELGEVMATNWKGYGQLRLRMLRSKRKWGNNCPEANVLGAELIGCYGSQLNGKPNSRGGVFLASGHSARQFIELGHKTGATPDGRKAGEEISKNLSPAMGADTEGATALVNTLASSDVTCMPGDYPLDMMLHPSACSGDKGLRTMRSLVKQFHKNGGSVIQFTVFSADELRDAQKHPERYENLQVRVCGWNVRWNDMSKKEQDAYITRAEGIADGTHAATNLTRRLRVLAIGNSYTQSLEPELPKVARSAGVDIDLAIFAIGGKSLSNHWENCEASLKDSAVKHYTVGGRKTNLPEMLSEGTWDVITLQDQSEAGMYACSFDPWADRLVAYIRKKQPKARLFFQLTWADPAFSQRISDGKGGLGTLKMTQDEMAAALEDNYTAQARRLGLGLIPVGPALQEYRKKLPVTVGAFSPEYIASLQDGQLPDIKGELVGWYAWSKGEPWHKDYGTYRLRKDYNHLNREGKYLQACVWLASLAGIDVSELPYEPDFGDDFRRRAPLIRRCAAVNFVQDSQSR